MLQVNITPTCHGILWRQMADEQKARSKAPKQVKAPTKTKQVPEHESWFIWSCKSPVPKFLFLSPSMSGTAFRRPVRPVCRKSSRLLATSISSRSLSSSNVEAEPAYDALLDEGDSFDDDCCSSRLANCRKYWSWWADNDSESEHTLLAVEVRSGELGESATNKTPLST